MNGTISLFGANAETPRVSAVHRVRLAPAAARLWRVVAPDGRVIGHLQALGDGPSVRWVAKRFHVASRAFRELGEFWSAGDAIDALRFAR